MLKSFLSAVAVCCAFVFGCAVAQCGEATNSIKILSPRNGESVANRDEVVVQSTDGSLPVIAVRSAEKNSLWWIQAAAESKSKGLYAVKSRFGNKDTPTGSRFQFVVLLPPSDAVAKFKAGLSMKTLPADVRQSKVTEVVVDHSLLKSDGGTLQVKLVTPDADARVARVQEIKLKLDQSHEILPIMLVRYLENNSRWWVQDELTAGEEGELVGKARFGNDKTPAESNFLLVVVQPASPEERASLTMGASLKELPKMQRSKAFVFRSDDRKASAVASAGS